jgi:hypothetical protein
MLSLDRLGGYPHPWQSPSQRSLRLENNSKTPRLLASEFHFVMMCAASMAEHKFKIGATVYFHSRSERKMRSGPCQIIGLLPAKDGKFQYLIKSEYENHERVVKESELSRY